MCWATIWAIFFHKLIWSPCSQLTSDRYNADPSSPIRRKKASVSRIHRHIVSTGRPNSSKTAFQLIDRIHRNNISTDRPNSSKQHFNWSTEFIDNIVSTHQPNSSKRHFHWPTEFIETSFQLIDRIHRHNISTDRPNSSTTTFQLIDDDGSAWATYFATIIEDPGFKSPPGYKV
jgi:hypothetical protein